MASKRNFFYLHGLISRNPQGNRDEGRKPTTMRRMLKNCVPLPLPVVSKYTHWELLKWWNILVKSLSGGWLAGVCLKKDSIRSGWKDISCCCSCFFLTSPSPSRNFPSSGRSLSPTSTFLLSFFCFLLAAPSRMSRYEIFVDFFFNFDAFFSLLARDFPSYCWSHKIIGVIQMRHFN